MRLGVLAGIALMVSTPGFAKPATLGSKNAAAELDLREKADQIFLTAWRKEHADAVAAGLQATEMRKFSLWLVVGYSLGLCQKQANANDEANWEAAFDRIGIPLQETRIDYHKIGMDSLAMGRDKDASDADRAKVCASHLPAARNILRTL